MRSSPKLRPGFWDAWVVAAVLALAAGCMMLLHTDQTDARLTAVVSVDGVETERIPLEKPERETYVVTGNGYTLQMKMGKNEIWVETSDCPTQDCVHTGHITRSGQSIVCLPARVIVQLEGGADDGALVDAVIG